jgi:hypothetical protein
MGTEKVQEIRPGIMDQHGRSGGGSGSNDGTETRIARIEAVLPMLATKGDVSEAKSSIVMWVAGIGFAITAIIVSVMTFMLNRAIPVQTQSATQPSPIIIYPAPPITPPAAQSPQGSKRGLKP